jgi:hypothetical protein
VRLPLKGGPIQTIDTTETREGPPLERDPFRSNRRRALDLRWSMIFRKTGIHFSRSCSNCQRREPSTATRIASCLSDIPRVYVTDEAEALKLAIVDFRIRNPHLGEAPWRSISEKLNDAKLAGELGFEPRLTESESAVLPLNYSPPNCK